MEWGMSGRDCRERDNKLRARHCCVWRAHGTSKAKVFVRHLNIKAWGLGELSHFPYGVSEIKGMGVTSGENSAFLRGSQITHRSQYQNCFFKLCGNLGAFEMESLPAWHLPQAQSLQLAPWVSAVPCGWVWRSSIVLVQRLSPRGVAFVHQAWCPGAQVESLEQMNELMTSYSKLQDPLWDPK